MQEFNALTLKALLLDCIMHSKHGTHLAPNYKVAKKTFCNALGISERTTSKKLISYIGKVYYDNGMGDNFMRTLNRFGI